MKSDLSNVKVGDWIWTVQCGWVKVEETDHSNIYGISTSGYRYTTDGKYNKADMYPAAFTEPPAEFNAGPKPSRFKKGDKVLVRNAENEKWHRRHFSHQDKNGEFHGFHGGADEWSAQDF